MTKRPATAATTSTRRALVVAALVLVMAACGDDGTDRSSDDTTTTAAGAADTSETSPVGTSAAAAPADSSATTAATGASGTAGTTGRTGATEPRGATGEAGATMFADCTSGPLGDFPRTVEHGLGTIEIDEPPERVVALGNDGDFTAAMGIVPVAVTHAWYADDGMRPWFADFLGDEVEAVEALPPTEKAPIETIAELRPDLISAATYWTIGDEYDALSQIGAPVVGYVDGADTDTWQDQLALIAGSLGVDEQGACVSAAVEGLIDDVVDRHPEWAGKTFASAYNHGPGSIRVLTSTDDKSVQFLQQLGLELAPGAEALPLDPAIGGADISYEQLGSLDADVLLMAFATPELQRALVSHPLFEQVPAVRDGRYISVDVPLASALREPTPLSIPYALDVLEPELTNAISALDE